MILPSRTTSRAWRCTIAGCRCGGAGYGSERAAADAERRHVATDNLHDLHHRPAQTGVAQ